MTPGAVYIAGPNILPAWLRGRRIMVDEVAVREAHWDAKEVGRGE